MNDLQTKLLKKYQDSHSDKVMERYNHSLSVAKKAVELIKHHNLNIDIKKAEIAGLIHDYAKFLTMDEYFEIVKEYSLDIDVLDSNFKVLHALLGPYVIKKDLGIDDEEILSAVKYHTTGRANMQPLEEIIYLADFIEDTREGVDFIRQTANVSIKKAIALALDFTLNKVLKLNRNLHPETLKAYQYYQQYLDDFAKIKSILKTLDHNLIKDVMVYDLRNNTPLFDYFIIVTALSQKQMQAAANYLKTEHDIRGIEEGEAWTLVDLQDIIVHIFLEEEREKYALDKLLKDVPHYVIK
jgi:ribosome silencing factor RsfS/YbeB/iojap